ncbi:MAG: 8-amino-7-oxononanoate synthase [Rickettsiales bacterium]|nr:8-amino-7-oxononanoate synthase [Rickettsiales bacterium]
MNSLTNFARRKLTDIKSASSYRSPITNTRHDSIYVTRDSQKLVSFCCNDYLGLAHHPEVMKAAKEAIEHYGFGAGSSRYITGNHPLYHELEQTLSTVKGTDDSIIFGSGYLANVGVIPSLVSKPDVILADKLVHACMIDGIQLSGAKYYRFRHNDLDHLEQLLTQYRDDHRHCLILTETVFSMDGDQAPINEMLNLCAKHDSWLMSDDAHGFGIIKHETPDDAPYIQMGTLSKAVGAYGGYVAASLDVIDYLRNTSRTAIYNTALPPAVIAAAHQAIKHIHANPEIATVALENAKLFCLTAGLAEAQSTIVPVIIGDNDKTLAIAKTLRDEGFLVSAIRPPTVPTNTARLRFTFSSLHQKDDIVQVGQLIKAHIE